MISFELEQLSQWPALLCVLDFHGHFQQINSAWRQIGLSTEQLAHTTFTDWIHPEETALVQSAFSELSQSNQKVVFETRWRNNQGEYHWIVWTAVADTHSNVLYAVGLDISRKRQDEHRYEAIFQGLHEGVLVYDVAGRITACNQSATYLLGIATEHLLHHSDWDLVTIQEDGSHFLADMHPAIVTLRTGKPCTDVVVGVYRPDDTFVWLNLNSQALRSPTESVVLSLSDISERKNTEENLREKLSLLSSVFEETSVGIAVTDDEGRFIRVNPAYCQLYGYAVEELIGQPFTLLLSPVVREEAARTYTNFLAGNIENSGRWPTLHHDGHSVTCATSETRLIGADGHLFRLTVVTSTAKSELPINQAAHQNFAWLHTFLAHLPATVFRLDREGHVLFVGGQHLNLLGLKEDKVVGQSIFAVSHHLSALIPDFQRALNGETFSKVLNHGGISFETKYMPLLQENERVGILAVFYDITEQRVLKARLENAVHELELISPYTSLGLLTIEGHKILRINQQASVLLGYSQTELLKAPASRLYRSPEEYIHFHQQSALSLSKGHSYCTNQSLRRRDGSFISCKITVEMLGKSPRVLWLLESTPEAVQKSEDSGLESILWTISNDGLLLLDANLRIQQSNTASVSLTGYGLDELKGKTLQDLDTGKQDQLFYQEVIDALKQRGCWQGVLWQRHKNESLYLCEVKIQTVNTDKGGTRYVALLSKPHLTESHLVDPLTTLPNRLLFRYSLRKTQSIAQRSSKRFAVLLISIDDLDTLNKVHGCSITDQFLKTVGLSLRSTVRDSDTVARYDGDVFSVSLDEISQPQDAGLVGQMMLFKLTQPFIVRGHKVQAQASVGIAVYPEDGNRAENLLDLAHQALQQAKEHGGGQCYFYNRQLQEQW